jgi:PRTRC genetic system ThiF family protein
MKSLPDIYTLHKYEPAHTILLIGCGGTGGYVVAHLARFVSVLNASKADKDKIVLILADGDIVEEKNLKRQHFISCDIGRNKAEALAERYSLAFGIEIAALKKDIESAKDLGVMDGFCKYNKADLVISCVDNNATRKVIWEWFKMRKGAAGHRSERTKFWIDSGNEETAGQVICGFCPSESCYYNTLRPSRNEPARIGQFSIPCAMEVYPDLLDSESRFNSELSCAERAASAPQNMQTNVTAATLIMNFAQKVIEGAELKSFAVEFSINNVFTTKHLTLDNLSLVTADRKAYWEK